MSEPIPESIPQSQAPRPRPPSKRPATTATTQQAADLASLFSKPDREIILPTSTTTKLTSLALTTSTASHLPAPPEIVANVQGSSAGAGSGEFHVYKASRRREYERVRLMEAETRREEADRGFEQRRDEWRRRDQMRTEKRRRKRGGRGKKGTDGKDEEVEADEKREGERGNGGHEADMEIEMDTEMEGAGERKLAREHAARVDVDPVGVVICEDD